MGRPTPPLTTDPCEIDWKEKRVKWTQPWWNYFDALQRTVDDDATDEDVIDAFTRINSSAVEQNPALAQFLKSPGSIAAPDVAAFLRPQQPQPETSSEIPYPTPQAVNQSGLQAAILAFLLAQSQQRQGPIIVDTAANLTNYAAGSNNKRLYFAYDTQAAYISDGSVWRTPDFLQEVLDAETAVSTTVRQDNHRTSNVAGPPYTAAGFGLNYLHRLDNSAKTLTTAFNLRTEWVTATDGAEDSQSLLQLIVAAALTTIRTWTQAGHLIMNIATGMLKMGGTTSSFPALARNGANLRARLADNSASTDIEVLDEAYNVSDWDGSLEVPTKNALRDKLETLTNGEAGALVSDAVYGAGWDGVTGIAPSKNAVFDKTETLLSKNGVNFGPAAPASITIVDGQVTAFS